MLRLRGKVQHYDWGRLGAESRVGRLYAQASGSLVAEDVPYAELWLGTHESGPSVVLLRDEIEGQQLLLREWLRKNPEALGDPVLQRWHGELPFLFKVLSIRKALSIQAHPNKNLAKQLHQQEPQIYRDDNHKPEMAVALTEFEALCGFITSQELAHAMAHVPELRLVVGEEAANLVFTAAEKPEEHNGEAMAASPAAAALKAAFSALMTAEEDTVGKAVHDLVLRLRQEQHNGRRWTAKEELLVRLEQQFPGDIGVLAAIFLNHVKLGEGEALYLAADEPHAYVSGECVECMAASDNVVRAGLTPKFRDTATLCSMLTYRQGMPEVVPGRRIDPFIWRYQPPFDEFEVDAIGVQPGCSSELPELPGPSIFIVLRGAGTIYSYSSSRQLPDQSLTNGGWDDAKVLNQLDHILVTKGDAFFVPAGLGVIMKADNHAPLLQMFRAGVSSRVFKKKDEPQASNGHR